MVGNENFSASSLPIAAQSWHSTLITNTEDITATFTTANWADIQTGDMDAVGERLGFVVLALLNAFRVTGDLRLLDRADVLMQEARSTLTDVDLDTYDEWVVRNPALSGFEFYLTDVYMAKGTLAGLVNQYAHVMSLNKYKTSPAGISYSERATFWINHSDNHMTPDWGFPADNLRHRTMAGLRGMYYYWKRTGDTTAKSKFDEYLDYLYDSRNLVTQNGRYLWDHNTPFAWFQEPVAIGWEGTNYAQYTLASAMDLALEGVEPFKSDIGKYAATTEAILADGINNIKNDVECVDSGSWAASKLLGWSLLGAGRWRPALHILADDVMAIPSTVPNAMVPAWMLVATTS